MPPSVRGWAWALCVGLGAAASARAEPPEPPLCDARALGEEARRDFEAGLAALKRDAHEAVPPLRRALEREPRAAVVRMALGSALAKVGRSEAAASEYAAFASACPEHPRADQILRMLADYVRVRGQMLSEPEPAPELASAPASEEVTPEQPARDAPASAPTPEEVTPGQPARDVEPPAPAGKALCDARRLPAPVRARYEAGERHLREARFAEAARELLGALELEPRAAAAQLLLGATYARLGEPMEGARAYASFLAACPAHPQAPTVRKLLTEYHGAH